MLRGVAKKKKIIIIIKKFNKISVLIVHLYSGKFKNTGEKKLRGLNNWKDIPCSYIKRYSINNTPLIYRFNAVSFSISVAFFVEIDNLTLKFV